MIPLLVRACPFVFFSFLLHFFILSLSLLLVVPVAPRYGRLTGGGVVMMNPHAAATRSCGRTAAFSGSHFHFHSHSQFQSHIPVLYRTCTRTDSRILTLTHSHPYARTRTRSRALSFPFAPVTSAPPVVPHYSLAVLTVPRGHTRPRSTSGVAAFPPLVCRLAYCVFLILM